MTRDQELRTQIIDLVKEYYEVKHANNKGFKLGESKINYAGRVFDSRELELGVKSVLDFWLTAGPYAQQFESKLKDYFGCKDALTVNSGSSANLVMMSTLKSEQVKNRLVDGDEVITPAATFPTTLTPILQNNLVPVFVDCKPGEYNMDMDQIEESISPKTKAIFIPHTVGLPADMDRIMDIAKKHNLFVLEDGCDALGGTWDGKLVGTFGDMSSISFYPAHHMTMGEGGMVIVNNPALAKTALSIRDWGRDCWCDPGVNDTCGKRFDWSLGDLPHGYDHKYIYSNLGYNLKVTEMQAAIGLAQFEKLDSFVERRRSNANFYQEQLKQFENHIILPIVPKKANPSWFCFPITVKDHISREKLISWLEKNKIETRLIFSGNVLKQPGFVNIPRRIHGELTGTDEIMSKTFFIGIYPGLTDDMREFVVDKFKTFFTEMI